MQSYKHFTLTERESLSELYKQGKKASEIAIILERSRSSIFREIKRNKNKDGTYHPWRATTLYIVRRKKSVRRPRFDESELKLFVTDKLNEFWSPEAITIRWNEYVGWDYMSIIVTSFAANHPVAARHPSKEEITEKVWNLACEQIFDQGVH